MAIGDQNLPQVGSKQKAIKGDSMNATALATMTVEALKQLLKGSVSKAAKALVIAEVQRRIALGISAMDDTLTKISTGTKVAEMMGFSNAGKKDLDEIEELLSLLADDKAGFIVTNQLIESDFRSMVKFTDEISNILNVSRGDVLRLTYTMIKFLKTTPIEWIVDNKSKEEINDTFRLIEGIHW